MHLCSGCMCKNFSVKSDSRIWCPHVSPPPRGTITGSITLDRKWSVLFSLPVACVCQKCAREWNSHHGINYINRHISKVPEGRLTLTSPFTASDLLRTRLSASFFWKLKKKTNPVCGIVWNASSLSSLLPHSRPCCLGWGMLNGDS